MERVNSFLQHISTSDSYQEKKEIFLQNLTMYTRKQIDLCKAG
jgi:hypothetical protein